MKILRYFVSIHFIFLNHYQLEAINFKALYLAGFIAQQAQSNCRIYNPTSTGVTVENYEWSLLNVIFKSNIKNKVSTTVIPAGTFQEISDCTVLQIETDETTQYKTIQLSFDYQPKGEIRAFNLFEEPCYHDCQGATKQIRLLPGLPAEKISCLSDLSYEELNFLSYQLQHTPDSLKGSCSTGSCSKRKHLR
jgi:hypothetical protein